MEVIEHMLKDLSRLIMLAPEDDKGGNADKDANPSGQQGDGQQNQQAQPFAIFPDEKSFMSRVSREAKKLFGDKLKELGFDDETSLKGIVDAAKAAEDAKKTELEKAMEAVKKAQQERDAIAGERDKALTEAQEILLHAEIIRQAATLGVVDPDAAAALMSREKVKVEGRKVEGVKEALEDLVKAKPYLKGQATQNAGGQVNPAQGNQEVDLSKLSMTDYIKLRNEQKKK